MGIDKTQLPMIEYYNLQQDYADLQCRYARLHAAAEKMANGLCYDNLSELRGVLNALKLEELGDE